MLKFLIWRHFRVKILDLEPLACYSHERCLCGSHIAFVTTARTAHRKAKNSTLCAARFLPMSGAPFLSD